MIRRNPTLIPLGDADALDVKEFMARRKHAAEHAAREKAKKKDEKKAQAFFVASDDAKRKREAMTRDERLGLR